MRSDQRSFATAAVVALILLSGPIPAELGGLTDLRELWLGGNQLSGCIPAGLETIPNSDLATLRLSFCN